MPVLRPGVCGGLLTRRTGTRRRTGARTGRVPPRPSAVAATARHRKRHRGLAHMKCGFGDREDPGSSSNTKHLLAGGVRWGASRFPLPARSATCDLQHPETDCDFPVKSAADHLRGADAAELRLVMANTLDCAEFNDLPEDRVSNRTRPEHAEGVANREKAYWRCRRGMATDRMIPRVTRTRCWSSLTRIRSQSTPSAWRWRCLDETCRPRRNGEETVSAPAVGEASSDGAGGRSAATSASPVRRAAPDRTGATSRPAWPAAPACRSRG